MRNDRKVLNMTRKFFYILPVLAALLLAGCGTRAAGASTAENTAPSEQGESAISEKMAVVEDAAEPEETAPQDSTLMVTPADPDASGLEISGLSPEALLRPALQERDAVKIQALLRDHPELGDALAEKVQEECNALNYDVFLFLDELIEKLPEGECRSSLSQYAGESEVIRLQAFLNGTWAWYFEEGVVNPAIVELNINPDGTGTGIVVKAGGDLVKYRFVKGDVYWRDFEYQSGNAYSCYNLTKTTSGTVHGATASVTVDYENEVLHMHLTPISHSVSNPDRDWVRYEQDQD